MTTHFRYATPSIRNHIKIQMFVKKRTRISGSLTHKCLCKNNLKRARKETIVSRFNVSLSFFLSLSLSLSLAKCALQKSNKKSLCEMNKCSSRLATKPDTTKNLIKGKGQSSAALVFPCHPLLMGYRQLDLASTSSTSSNPSKTSCNSSPVEQRIPKALNCSQSSLLSPFSQSVNLSPVNRQVPYPYF